MNRDRGARVSRSSAGARARDVRAHAWSRRCGAALLEIVAALAILGLAGMGFVALIAQELDGLRALRQREATTRRAANLLSRITTWTPRELDARVGVSRFGDFRVEIELIDPSLYTVVVTDGTGSSTLLETSLYAPEAEHTAPR